MITYDPRPAPQDEMPLEYNQQEQRVEGPGFKARILLDQFNLRLKVQRHSGEDIPGLVKRSLEIARDQGLTKISFLSREEEWETFLSRGFVLEGILNGYYLGRDGYIMARFLDPKRRYSKHLEDENQAMEEIMESPVGVEIPELDKELELRNARSNEAGALAAMYRKVFDTYPTPIFNEDYLLKEIEEGMLYKAVWSRQLPVSASSADIDEGNKAAELTDCGTIPEFRGQGLVTLLIHELEEELRHRGFLTFYGMARSLSYGMNLVFRRFGYQYRGRLINHGHISGKFEDLNIWVKQL